MDGTKEIAEFKENIKEDSNQTGGFFFFLDR